jgi:hypothetical protein
MAGGTRTRERGRFRRRWARWVAVGWAAVTAGLCVAVTDAHAGTYSVWANCSANHSWTAAAGSRGSLPAYTDCNGANVPAGMKMFATPQNDTSHFSANGDQASFTFRAPTGARIFGLDYDATTYWGATSFCLFTCSSSPWSYQTGLLADNPLRETGLHCASDNLGQCYTQSGPSYRGKVVNNSLAGLNEGSLSFFVKCAGASCPSQSDGDAGHFYSRAWLSVSAARVDLSDLTSPTLTGAGGDAWSANGTWLSGTQALHFNAHDNTGLQRMRVEVDGGDTATIDDPQPCDYTYAVPCGDHSSGASASYDRAFNTADVPDGTHTIRVAAQDASGNWQSSDHSLRVDNHAPGEPENVTVHGGEDWHTVNDFDIDWDNPDGQAAPITRAHYELCDNTGTCTSDTQNGVHISSLDDVKVPQPGDYTLRVWLEDAAGNATPTAKTRELRLMFDDVAPAEATPQHRNGWVNRSKASEYVQKIEPPQADRVPVSGIDGYAITTDGTEPAKTTQVKADRGDWSAQLEIGDLPEGVTHLKARAISGARIASAEVGLEDIHVDATAPTTIVEGQPDPNAWSRTGQTIAITAREPISSSGMAGAEPGDPEDVHGGYVTASVDRAMPHRERGPVRGEDPATGIRGFEPATRSVLSVDEDGFHVITYSATDVAGNESAERSLTFKVDKTAPELVVFEAQERDDPRQIRVAAADATSGLADGATIQLRRVRPGTGDWITLRTTREGSHYTASVDNSALPEGDYQFRATVPDQAGNEATGDRTRFGEPEMIHIDPTHIGPYETGSGKVGAAGVAADAGATVDTRTTVGIVSTVKAPAKKKCKTVRVKGKKRRKCKKVPGKASQQLVPRALVAFGKRPTVRGTLTTAGGQALGNRELTVLAKADADGADYQAEGVTRTDAAGRFKYTAPVGASRTLDFFYRGDGTYRHSDHAVILRVPASATLRASRKSVRNGSSVIFTGALLGRPYPAKGKVIDLQAYYRHRWRTFGTPRAGQRGRWKFRYRFEATRGRVTYRFRVRVRPSSDYPYELGYSKSVKVKVSGR